MDATLQAHEIQDKQKARIGAIVWIVLLFLLIIYPFMQYQDPPPGQEGILVNLGEIDVGDGEENAPESDAAATAPDTDIEEEPADEPEPAETDTDADEPEPEPQEPPKTTPTVDKKKVVESSAEEIAIKKQKEKEKREREAEDRKKAAEAAAKKKAEDARKKAAEEAARKKAAEEAARKAEEARKKAEADKFKSGISDLFGGDGKGDTGTSGNQGDPNGDPNSSNLEGISTGSGRVGGGLSSRGGKGPDINAKFNTEGRIVLRVCVDGSGRVISAKKQLSGSTSQSAQLIKLAEENAKKWRFKAGDTESCGTITYDFKFQ